MDDQGLNRFVSSVSSRYNHDTIITGGSMALLLLVPVACTFIAGYLLNNNSELNTDTGQCTTTIMVIESLMIMFIMLSMYNRLSEHSARDHEWRAGLISYAEDRGCDVSKLARMDLEWVRSERGLMKIPALAVMAFAVALIPLSMHIMFSGPAENWYYHGFDFVLLSIATAFAMFFLVFITILRYPYVHEHRQVEFTNELAKRLTATGLYIEPMPEVIKHRPIWIHILLFVCTLGLYSFVMLFIVYRSTNNHIYNQWHYEDRLMVTLMKAEGIERIEPAEKKRLVERLKPSRDV